MRGRWKKGEKTQLSKTIKLSRNLFNGCMGTHFQQKKTFKKTRLHFSQTYQNNFTLKNVISRKTNLFSGLIQGFSTCSDVSNLKIETLNPP